MFLKKVSSQVKNAVYIANIPKNTKKKYIQKVASAGAHYRLKYMVHLWEWRYININLKLPSI